MKQGLDVPTHLDVGFGMGQVEETRVAEQSARAAAEEAELLRRVISQLPRPIMLSRTETSITLSLARLIKSSGDDKVPLFPGF